MCQNENNCIFAAVTNLNYIDMEELEQLKKENQTLRNKVNEIARIANSINKKPSMVSVEEVEKYLHINLEINQYGKITKAYYGEKKERKPRAPRKPKESKENKEEKK